MPSVTLDLTVKQIAVLQAMDAQKTARVVLQDHIDQWLHPFVDDLTRADIRAVKQAYIAADPETRQQVREDLGLG